MREFSCVVLWRSHLIKSYYFDPACRPLWMCGISSLSPNGKFTRIFSIKIKQEINVFSILCGWSSIANYRENSSTFQLHLSQWRPRSYWKVTSVLFVCQNMMDYWLFTYVSSLIEIRQWVELLATLCVGYAGTSSLLKINER